MLAKFRYVILLGVIGLAGCLPDDRPPLLFANSGGDYRLSSGDQIRVIVFEQPSLSNVYGVDATGNVSIPLAGPVKAGNRTARQVEAAIVNVLRSRGLVEDPKVAVEVAVYRPFSILGEVRNPGRYSYAPGMTIEAAVALAGGYTVHADKDRIRVTRQIRDDVLTNYESPTAILMPGDAVFVVERWF